MAFNQNLRKIRTARNISREQLAGMMGLSVSAVGLWESGHRQPDIKNVRLLACLLNCTSDELLDVPPAVNEEAELSKEEQMSILLMEEDLSDLTEKYLCLDGFGKKQVSDVLRNEFNRCKKYGTIDPAGSCYSTIVKIR